MGIADFFRPKYRHSDVRVRTEAVKALTSDDATTLIQIAKTDRDIGVRRIAIDKIDNADVLAELSAGESERSLRDYAGERAAQLWQSTACGDDAERAGGALGGIIKLGDQHVLVEIVVMAALPTIRKRAFGELRDPRALAALAKSDAPQDLRTGAVARIDDGDVLRALAIDTTQKEVGLAAVEKLDDIDRLEHVAQKAKNKAVRQKARKIVTEIQEAERAKKPGVPDDIKRKRAERAQLQREVDAVAETFDFAKAIDIVKRAEAAWAAVLDEEVTDDRFAKSVERFWRRKEIHEQQARSTDELRAIEREAQASKQRAAAERAARAEKPADAAKPATPEPDDYVRDATPDPKREARDAEAKAQRADDDARRQAQAEERAARAKEDAERGAAVSASLAALCDDMEQLGAGELRDTRAIDRVLAQAGKAFEQIGKVTAGERDGLADRYRAARGKLVTKAGELREAEDWQRWTNVPKAEALIETAKQMAEAPATPDLGNRLRQLQALWKEVGPMPSRRSKELWDTFKATCDLVYDKVKGQRAVDNEKFAEVTKVKEALIAEAEALVESNDWAATADKLKALQAQWKASGHLPRKLGDELWKRFRTACDQFFARRKPVLDAHHDEEVANLGKKQELIARAQAVADGAPGDGGWGKAIGTIKDLQREWQDVGYVPRRDADAVYRGFRAACDSLFAKRDAARDAEANAHRDELDAVKREIDAVTAGGGAGHELVARAIAVRAKAQEQHAHADAIDAMVRHVLEHHGDAVKGTELDPAQLRAKREKIIAKAEELLPKQPAAVQPQGDVAAQLKAAMRQNAFGDLKWSGRDPVEVLDELRLAWNDIGPILDDEDHVQSDRFEAVYGRVLEANGRQPRRSTPEAEAAVATPEPSRGRRRRDRGQSAELPAIPAVPAVVPVIAQAAPAVVPVIVPVMTTTVPAPMPEPSPLEIVPDAAASAVATIAAPDEITATASIPIATHDAITQPAKLPPEVPIGMPESAVVAPEPPPVVARVSSRTLPPPPMDDVDTGWDLGDDDPTAGKTEDSPSSLEMAGDGSTEGDGLDTVD